jgi:D-3-phosphoglycerate dehydrogenase
VHARLTSANQRMFSSDAFALMRPGSFFINTAREGLVDEAALYLALSSGQLGGAALDVLERAGERQRLLCMPNVFITPHIGGATAETLARGARRAVAAVGDLLAGRMPADVINPQVLRAAL